MKRDYPAWVAVVTLCAFGLPVTPAHSQDWTLQMCQGEAKSITVPVDPAQPVDGNDRDCCRKACHAGSGRRKAAGRAENACC